MMQQTEDIEAYISSALKPGSIILPQHLLDAVEQLTSPLSFLTSPEPEAEPFDALRKKYPALHNRRYEGRQLSSEESEQAIGLLRWVLQELSGWTRKCDQRLERLTAVFVLLNEFDLSDTDWASLSEQSVNCELIKFLLEIVKNYRCKISIEPGSRSAATKALLNSLTTADNEGDWITISESWSQVETWLDGGLFLKIAVQCIARFNMNALASEMNKVSQVQIAYLVAKSLSEENRIKLARITSSNRYRFAAMLSLAWRQNKFTKLDSETQKELSELLIDVSKDSDQWPRWMQAFNQYPIRFPALQSSLGRALADAPDHALESYVESISLYACQLNATQNSQTSNPDGRRCVRMGLSVFVKAAAADQRKKLWHLAYTRWQSWNFGLQSSPKQHLGGIVGCELDFAITAYEAECLTPKERKTQLASLIQEFRYIETRWHSSILDLRTERYKLKSKMQPLLAAESSNWLFTQQIIPSEITQTPYTQRKFEQ